MKGITVSWAGTLYRKLEAMCIEVEENMYQDAVKYVENQVHTIGVNVKKFYSDVLQDLSEGHTDVGERDSVGSIYNSSKHQNTGVGIEDVSMDVDMENATGGDEPEPEQSRVDFFRSSGDGHLTSYHERCLSDEGSQHSYQINEKTTDQAGSASLTENLYVDNNAGQSTNSAVGGAGGADICESDFQLSSSSNASHIDQHPSESTIPVHVKHMDLSMSPETEEVRRETTINFPPCDICSNQSLLKDGGALTYSSNRTELGMDPLKHSSESVEVPMHPSETKPEERCIIMDASKCHLTSRTESKYKSYKTRIRHAILAAAKSERKLEYEQLALCHKRPVFQVNSEAVTPCVHEDDSDWEFV